MPRDDSPDQGANALRSDCMVLAGVVLLSTLPYLFGIGFYSDDWMYQAWLTHHSGQGISSTLWALLRHDPSLRVRPVQAIYLVTSFRIFGRQPVGYHILDAAILAVLTVMLYLLLRELRVGCWLEFTIPLVFALLPHYSTDRFWISSQQATLSLLFAIIGFYGVLRWRSQEDTPKRWLILGVGSLVLGILSYEVPVGLILAFLGFMAFSASGTPRHLSRKRLWKGLALVSLLLLALGIAKIGLQTRIQPHYHFLKRLGGLSWHATVEAVRFNLWTYGLHLPAVLSSLHRHGAISWSALAVAGVLGVCSGLYLWMRLASSLIPNRRACLSLIAAGFVIFGLGYALFFPNPAADFSSAGLRNRVVIASALGAACVAVGVLGLGCSLLGSHVARARAFSVAIAGICAMYCLVVSGISSFWTGARSQQAAVLTLVSENLTSLPNDSVVLLDGFCRYSGPAVVFETDWDTTGALQLTLGNESMAGNAVSPDMRFGDAIVDPIGKVGEYSYGPRLYVYNLRRNIITPLPTKQAAVTYLSVMNPAQDSGCPPARNGDGVRIF